VKEKTYEILAIFILQYFALHFGGHRVLALVISFVS